MPNDKAHPAIGKAGQLETVKEERVEVTCDEASIKQIISAIRQAHPYEEPVIDSYPLINIDDYK